MVMRLGSKAEGADFFDRVTERDDLWRYLEGNHIVLSGPRRLGKTSLLQRLAEEAEEKGLLARLVDVGGINSAEAFVGALEGAFPDESITGYLKLEAGSSEKVLIQSDVDDGYDRLLASRSRFIHWYQRLERDLAEPDFSFALAILGALTKSEEGLMRKQLLVRLQRREPDPDQRTATMSRLLLKLEEDGYVDGTGERIVFLSFLLRDYWRRNHA